MLDQLTPRYENFVIVGDLNSEENNYEISNFIDIYGLKKLIKSPTCNKTSGFQNTSG